MDIYIDCEWNSFGGDLISIALCAEDGSEFYGVLGCDDPHPWIVEHVMPHIDGDDIIEKDDLQDYLQQYLMRFQSINIVADWPEDIERFCNLLITGPGTRIDTPKLTMEVIRTDAEIISKIPHHALWDARANREHFMGQVAEKSDKTVEVSAAACQHLTHR